MPETPSKPSAKASQLAAELIEGRYINPEKSGVDVAALIDAALAELLRTGRKVHNWIGDDSSACHDAHAEFGEALAPWEPESGDGR